MPRTLTERLSQFACSIRYSHLPPEVVHQVKRRVIDSLGCAAGAFSSKPVKVVVKLARTVATRPGATILGTRHKSSLDLAAFANGTMVRYLDYNDSYFSQEVCHPSDNIAAALAVGEAMGSSGKEVIAAIVLGYEVACRLCDAASLRTRGWDHATYAAISSSLVAGKLLRLTAQKTEQSLVLAVAPNIALRQTRVGELSMWKGCSTPNAVRNGILAALLAREGMVGPKLVFEGEMGFMKQVSGPFSIAPLDGADHRFKVLQTSLKAYPVDYSAQTAVQAALELRRNGISPDAIRRVEVETFRDAVMVLGTEKEKWNPNTRETADHSLPYCVAVALLDGKVGVKQFTNAKLHDPILKRLIAKVSVKENLNFTDVFPEALTSSVRVVLKDGREVKRKVRYPKGHLKNPMSDGEVEEKFHALTRPFLPRTRMDMVLGRLWRLERMPKVDSILRLLVRGGRLT